MPLFLKKGPFINSHLFNKVQKTKKKKKKNENKNAGNSGLLWHERSFY